MRTEGKVVVAILVSLIALELVVRVLEPKLSNDVRNMIAHERLPGQVARGREEGRFTVLVVGNSLSRACLDPVALERELERKGYAEPEVLFLAPDGSGINEWTAAYRKYFPPESVGPDWVVLVSGQGHLADRPVASPEKLAAYHVARGDSLRIFRDWFEGANPRSRFALAWVSRFFGSRERVRPLLFYNAVPGYEAAARRINGRANRSSGIDSEDSPTARRLTEFFRGSGLRADQIFIVAAAIPERYRLATAVKDAASASEVVVIEEGAQHSWPSHAFPDGYHLAPEFAAEFTRKVASRLPDRR